MITEESEFVGKLFDIRLHFRQNRETIQITIYNSYRRPPHTHTHLLPRHRSPKAKRTYIKDSD